MTKRKPHKRAQYWAGHALIVAVIVCGVSAVNHSCSPGALWHPQTVDAMRAVFLAVVVLAIAVSFSGKGPEGRA